MTMTIWYDSILMSEADLFTWLICVVQAPGDGRRVQT